MKNYPKSRSALGPGAMTEPSATILRQNRFGLYLTLP